jgi:HK97 gp10 family phage protein
MASATWDDTAFQSALKHRMARLEESANDLPERMTRDMASKAQATVKRRTGQTAAGIDSQTTGKGEAEANFPNPYLEFGTSRMDAQPFARPARAEVIEAYRAGHYKPEM